jgi:nucleoside-diphosphate-sugar epimerase
VRVLVVGGTGFVGGAAVRRLLEGGHAVAAFHRGEASGGAQTIRGDRRELTSFREAFRRFGPEVVLDTIAYTEGDGRTFAEAFRGLAPRLVVLSSQDVYASYGRLLRLEDGPAERSAATEDSPLRTSRYPYRAMAKPGEMAHDYEKTLVESAALSEADAPVTILRLPKVYGPGDPQRRLRPYLDRMGSAEAEILLDRAKTAWRWTRGYLEDVADAIALATTDPRAGGRVYNVGEPDAPTEAEWVRAIGEAAGWRGEVRAVSREELPEELREPYDFTHDLASDTSRIRRELSYRERIGRAEGLRRTVAAERSG